MKKLFFLLLLVSQTVFAQTVWTVRNVPNTRLEGNEIHVSDPDGYLSDSAEWFINDALGSIRDQADVFLVTLTSIGNDEPKHFATALFNYWGIGDAETDNGVLLLFVEDQHALEFETGYGAENVLTDARCSRIFNNTIVPYFMEGNYEAGLCAGVIDIVEVYDGAVPTGLRAMTPVTQSDESYSDDEEDLSFGEALVVLLFVLMAFIVPIISFLRWITGLLSGKKKKDDLQETQEVYELEGVNYINGLPAGWKSSVWEGKGFIRFLLYGVGALSIFLLAQAYVPQWFPEASEPKQDFWSTFLGMIGYFTVTSLVQNTMLLSKAKKAALSSKSPKGIYTKALNDGHSVMMRVLAPWVGIPFGMLLRKRKKNSAQCLCPSCGAEMYTDESFVLPAKRAAEQQAGAYVFTPSRCPSGHRYVLRENGPSLSSVQRCKSCGVLASKVVSERTTVAPTYSSQGIKETTYECQFCHTKRTETRFVPKLTHSTTSSSSSGRSYHSSSHSGGSFGGGRSGGGGFSGRW
jgi:uncharacterized protein